MPDRNNGPRFDLRLLYPRKNGKLVGPEMKEQHGKLEASENATKRCGDLGRPLFVVHPGTGGKRPKTIFLRQPWWPSGNVRRAKQLGGDRTFYARERRNTMLGNTKEESSEQKTSRKKQFTKGVKQRRELEFLGGKR